MKKIIFVRSFFILIGALAMPLFSSAQTPKVLHYVCQSQEIGSVEISVRAEANNINAYVEVKRYDLEQKLVETRHQDYRAATNESVNNFSANFYDNFKTLSLRIPVTHADWTKHKNDCYAQSQFPGTWLTLNAISGEARNSDNIMITSELNPAATYKRIRDGFYYFPQPFVNGRRCDNTSDAYHSKIPVTCRSL